MILAGVGSRSAPPSALKAATMLAEEFEAWWRSGHAEGMDYAFEIGARDRCVVYLPWRGFNRASALMTRNVVVLSDLERTHHEAFTRARESVTDYHPNAERLSNGGFACMARNYLQIMGVNEQPVDGVVFWAEEQAGRVSGGTAQAIRIARAMGIPTWNLYLQTYEEVRESLSALLG